MELDKLQNQVGEWLSGKGPESDIVISSRIRLARNVSGHSFLSRANLKDRSRLEQVIRDRLMGPGVSTEVSYFSLPDLSSVDRQFLVERHLISREHALGKGPRGVAMSPRENLSVMINEEDHLRIQGLHSGLQLRDTWEEINRLDTYLEETIDFAFDSQFGYLTICPTNAGTGMRASVMLHLPALVMTGQIEKVFQAVSKINLAVRGLYGEGTKASGDFYQISNQQTLGKSEGEIIRNVESVIPQIVKFERTVRETLLENKREVIEDKVWRAYGMLRSARIINSEETMDLLSVVRLGVNLGLIPGLRIQTINELFILSQPAHLQKMEQSELGSTERDITRATFIRNRLRVKDGQSGS